ncbi:MAG: NADH-quinone oxidoreductase subunit M [Gemmatimonadaceae bacterium]
MRDFLISVHYERWILPVLLLLPAIAAVFTWGHGLLVTVQRRRGPARYELARWLPLVTFLIEFALSLGLWVLYDPTGPAWQFAVDVPWIASWGIHFALGIDGISLFLVLLVTFMLPIAVLSSWTAIDRSVHSYHALFLALTTGMIGVFVARDLFLFYVFWEIVLVPMYLIIGVWGGERRIYASVKFFVYTFAGSLLMLVAIAYVGLKMRDPITGVPDFLYDHVVSGLQLTAREAGFLFSAFFVAFAVKIPLFPFHTWLPDAHVEAPTEGSVDLAAILLKMGSYGFLRLLLPLFPGVVMQPAVRQGVIALAIVGIVYGALVALVQPDFKKLIAYSSVSHMGFVVLGIFALSVESLQGAMMIQIAHGLSSGALFLLIGMIYDRRHTRLLSEYGGIARVMPLFSAFLLLMMLSSIGVPGLNGFVGEFLVILGSFKEFPYFTMVAASGVVLSAVYMLWAYQRFALNPLANKKNRRLPDLNWREAAMMIPIAAVVIWMGVHPAPFLRRMEPSLTRLVQQVESGAGRQRLSARAEGP